MLQVQILNICFWFYIYVPSQSIGIVRDRESMAHISTSTILFSREKKKSFFRTRCWVRLFLVDNSLIINLNSTSMAGRSHQADLFFSVRMPSDRHCESAPVFLLRKADHVVSWDTERVTKWGLVGHDRLFRSRVWRAVGEYERMQRQTATAAPDRDADHHGPARVVRAVRANSWESVQTRFMAESVARRYYESVHGLGFELFAWSDNAVEREARGDNAVEHDGSLGKFFFKVSWD